MIVTKYSLMMGIVWFTCVTFLGSCLLSREKGRTFQIVALVFLLGAARALLPVEILHGHVVQCWNLYPQVRVFGGVGGPDLAAAPNPVEGASPPGE